MPPKKMKMTKEDVEDIKYRTGKWLKEEEDILKSNAREYLQMHNLTLPDLFKLAFKDRKPFYKHCCQNINRKYVNVYKKAVRTFDEKNHLGQYTEQEIKILKKLDSTVKDENKWKAIGEKIGRSANSVRDRVTKIGAEPKNKRKNRWTVREKERFRKAFEQHGKDWQTVSEAVRTRTSRQCLKYWVDQRNAKNRGESLSVKDQVTMVELLSREPVNYADDIDWHKIAADFPVQSSTITPLNLKLRFKQLVLYRIPFHYQLNFNDKIEILMENFVKPFREGKLNYGAKKWKEDKKKKKQVQEDSEEEEENRGIKTEVCVEIEDEDEGEWEGETESGEYPKSRTIKAELYVEESEEGEEDDEEDDGITEIKFNVKKEPRSPVKR